MANLLAGLKSAATLATAGVALVTLVVATYKKVMFDRAAEKAKNDKDTSSLDQSLGE